MVRIFLCHAHEDKAQVRDIYQRLKQLDGLEPWLDEENLVGGQLWEMEIPLALNASDFILIFFSRTSVDRPGYMQREMKMALNAWEELPEGIIHTIPIRLDDCQIPLSFRRYQHIDIFDSRGFERLKQAIHAGLDQRKRFTPRYERTDGALNPKERPEAEAPLNRPIKPISPIDSNQKVPRHERAVAWARDHKLAFTSLVIAAISTIATVLSIPGFQQLVKVVATKLPKAWSAPLPENMSMEFVLIPAGTFQMGSDAGDNDERPVHSVTISKPFYLGKYEVTQAQWKAVMGSNPSFFSKEHLNQLKKKISSQNKWFIEQNPDFFLADLDHPVDSVIWNQVQDFINNLKNHKLGWECRLPTEAEWEYAAQVGITTEQNKSNLKDIAWYKANSNNKTHPVGQRLPNALGLYDMFGNVWEWCYDGKRQYTTATMIDPLGSTEANSERVLRGGGWDSDAQFLRAANRNAHHPDFNQGYIGFRCASSGPGQ